MDMRVTPPAARARPRLRLAGRGSGGMRSVAEAGPGRAGGPAEQPLLWLRRWGAARAQPSWGPGGRSGEKGVRRTPPRVPLSQAAVGGEGRRMARCPGWCRRMRGAGLGAGVEGPLQSWRGLGRGVGAPRAPPQRLSHALGVAEDAHGEVLDMRWPLRCQLEKLDVVPLHPIYGD